MSFKYLDMCLANTTLFLKQMSLAKVGSVGEGKNIEMDNFIIGWIIGFFENVVVTSFSVFLL